MLRLRFLFRHSRQHEKLAKESKGRFLLNKRLKPGKYEVMAAEQVQSNPLLMKVQFSKSKQENEIPAGSEHRVIDVNISKVN